MSKKGKFVVFEGIDGAGSSTQLNLLSEFLKGKKIRSIKTFEPSESVIGKLIRNILQGRAKVSPRALQLLYCADREEHLAAEIMPALEDGKFVLCDRYFYSTIVYGELNINKKWLEVQTQDFPRPDIAFLIDTPSVVAMKRMENRLEKEFFEKKELLSKVSKNYINLMENDKLCEVLDGTKSRNEIHEKVLEILARRKILQV